MEDESHLIQRSQQGELDAFNQLVERYQGHVYNLALRMLSDEGRAEDAAQETFISAYRAIGGFRGGSFRSWILRIVANTSRDFLRAAKVRQSISLEALEITQASTLTSTEESPEDHALRLELGRSIQQGLEALSHDHRLVLVLVDIQGFSYEEAARIAQTSVGTVRSRLSRARGQMRDLLRERPELLPGQFRLES
ncbi:MAG: sigma-70 family RNA polymerase sigma factor [Dehalococcoidia bacterium]